jgi:predicted acetyltransferase
MAGMDLRPVAAEEFRTFLDAVEHVFAGAPTDEDVALEGALFEADRSLVAEDAGRIVATAAALSLDLSVPGGSVPAAGVSYVSVQPTHRRQGLLRALMRRQLDDVHERGAEASAVLWASDPAIYGRFGYGQATTGLKVSVPVATNRVVSAADTGVAVRELPVADVVRVGGPVHSKLRRRRPGMLARDQRWWDRRLADPKDRRNGMSALRAAVAEVDGDVAGYALYAVKLDWENGGAAGRLDVRELVATEPQAEVALWRFLLGHDLVRTLDAWNLPSDSALLHLLADPRRPEPRRFDNLHVRLVDVRRALAERSYLVPGRVVVEVVDEGCPWNAGRLLLETGTDGVVVEPTDLSADLTLSATELGACYLGSTTLTPLHAAGHVDEHSPGAVWRADRMLSWPVAGWCPEVF